MQNVSERTQTWALAAAGGLCVLGATVAYRQKATMPFKARAPPQRPRASAPRHRTRAAAAAAAACLRALVAHAGLRRHPAVTAGRGDDGGQAAARARADMRSPPLRGSVVGVGAARYRAPNPVPPRVRARPCMLVADARERWMTRVWPRSAARKRSSCA